MTARTQNAGLARETAALAALSWWFQWGTGTGAAASANAVTTTNTTEARTSCVASQATTSANNDTLQLTGTITCLPGDTFSAGYIAITELGTFDAAGTGAPATGGSMDYYVDFAAMNLASGDSIAFTQKVQYS
jgi:hypothetical protein